MDVECCYYYYFVILLWRLKNFFFTQKAMFGISYLPNCLLSKILKNALCCWFSPHVLQSFQLLKSLGEPAVLVCKDNSAIQFSSL